MLVSVPVRRRLPTTSRGSEPWKGPEPWKGAGCQHVHASTNVRPHARTNIRASEDQLRAREERQVPPFQMGYTGCEHAVGAQNLWQMGSRQACTRYAVGVVVSRWGGGVRAMEVSQCVQRQAQLNPLRCDMVIIPHSPRRSIARDRAKISVHQLRKLLGLSTSGMSCGISAQLHLKTELTNQNERHGEENLKRVTGRGQLKTCGREGTLTPPDWPGCGWLHDCCCGTNIRNQRQHLAQDPRQATRCLIYPLSSLQIH